jgi:hypothetical protein
MKQSFALIVLLSSDQQISATHEVVLSLEQYRASVSVAHYSQYQLELDLIL